mmetsp:Transcript_21819/g.36443  ORF Transcript_21819/g.36443 Transcript_21819/m.36443 type:complete len:135 (+) Transcript_21819:122-526(+)|eukprot:CAMPEP_0198202742 /NCGR_PEP_ID=MMETSP1445-20131203/5956_1 /TAXON_ID=36898 /ORGANISM="Pyramimonas sp., Strain CCMP2087" /LENGTH=134 /DNA_ID=CAMNT_0043873817 /DNA_START=118 /DNA_END=522 /DNA_ORIENTATION=-
MGVYHCECGETMCGESFDCEECGFGDGDGNNLCQICAECHCADAETKETAMKRKDIDLIDTMLRSGVYEDQGKHSRERTIQSKTFRDILERLTRDPSLVVALIEKIDDESKRATKRLKKTVGTSAPVGEVITIE